MMSFKKALSKSYPIFCAFIPLGIGFGYMSLQLGLSAKITIIMAAFVYAGSAEFLIATMIANFVSFWDIIVATSLCNLRHIFYGLSVRKHYKFGTIKNIYMIYTLSDETYALLCDEKKPDPDFAFFICVLNHLYWVLGVFIGLIFGHFINIELKGLEFILTSLFTVLTIEQFYKIRKLTPFFLAFVSSILVLLIFPKPHMLFLSMTIVTIILLYMSNYSETNYTIEGEGL